LTDQTVDPGQLSTVGAVDVPTICGTSTAPAVTLGEVTPLAARTDHGVPAVLPPSRPAVVLPPDLAADLNRLAALLGHYVPQNQQETPNVYAENQQPNLLAPPSAIPTSFAATATTAASASNLQLDPLQQGLSSLQQGGRIGTAGYNGLLLLQQQQQQLHDSLVSSSVLGKPFGTTVPPTDSLAAFANGIQLGTNTLEHETMINATSANMKREKRKSAEYLGLLSFMEEGGLTGNDMVLKKLAEQVAQPDGSMEVRFIAECRGILPNGPVVKVVNNVLSAFFMSVVRKAFVGKDGVPTNCRHYKPISIGEKFKKIFAVLHTQGILVQMRHLNGFAGCLENVSKAEFKAALDADPNYLDACKHELSEEENQQIMAYLNSASYDLEGEGLQAALVYLMTLSFLLRGAGELHEMEWSNVEFGVFGPENALHGTENVSIVSINKTHKLSLRKSLPSTVHCLTTCFRQLHGREKEYDTSHSDHRRACVFGASAETLPPPVCSSEPEVCLSLSPQRGDALASHDASEGTRQYHRLQSQTPHWSHCHYEASQGIGAKCRSRQLEGHHRGYASSLFDVGIVEHCWHQLSNGCRRSPLSQSSDADSLCSCQCRITTAGS